MRVLFGFTLLLSAVVQLTFGVMLLADPVRVVGWGGMTVGSSMTDSLMSLTINLGALIVLCGAASGVAYRWSRQGRREGLVLGMGIGATLILMAVLHAAQGIATPVAFDGIRGLVLLGVGAWLCRRAPFTRVMPR